MAVVEITKLSKVYRLGEIGTGTISRDLERWYRMRILGQKDPFLKIGETNVREKRGKGDIVYSLKDINLKVEKGDAFGIIGKNGAGKSTLLKIISRVTSPSSGKIRLKGRVASLLEVGTGFHPELTGRENIFLNGAILGMRKNEITRKLDEIIDFSGVERYIDTPVKRYSSGMYVRLAFAVAAHLESEIMIVDEVLAVGDAEFQKKCLGKMGEASNEEGRTVLFVSHNMAAMQQLCQKSIILSNGKLTFMGTANEAVDHYINTTDKKFTYLNDGFIDIEQIREKEYLEKVFKKIRIVDKNNVPCETFPMLSSMRIEVELENTENYPDADYCISIYTMEGLRVTSSATWMYSKQKKKVSKKIILEIPTIKFSPRTYKVSLNVTQHIAGIWIDKIENAAIFHVESVDVFNSGREFTSDNGLVIPEGEILVL